MNPVAPHIIIDKCVDRLCIGTHFVQHDAVFYRYHLIAGKMKTIAPFHIVPVNKVVFRHDPDIAFFDKTGAQHNTAGRYRIAFIDCGNVSIVQIICIVGNCRKVFKIEIQSVLLYIFRIIHMVNDRPTHARIRMRIQIICQRADCIFIYQYIIIETA